MEPIESPLTWNEIEDYAVQVANGLVDESKGGFNREKESLRDFVVKLGGAISTLDNSNLKLLDSGSLKVLSPEKFEIYVSPFTGVMRDNFTIAHELGHFFLHYLPHKNEYRGQTFEIPRLGKGKCEQQANRFAAALLMPRAEFSALATATGSNVSILAGRFKVSRQAAEVRLASLNL